MQAIVQVAGKLIVECKLNLHWNISQLSVRMPDAFLGFFVDQRPAGISGMIRCFDV